MKTVKVCVIGCSGMGNLHMQGVIKKEGAELYAICDTDEQALKETFEKLKSSGVKKAVCDYRELVADPEIDAAVIVTPDQFHRQMTVDFLEAGKTVLCEKPMALNLDECQVMLDAQKRTGNGLMIGQVCRCTPAFILAKKLVDEGRIGELFFVESEYAHNYESAKGKNNWRMTPERHAFIGGACHAVDLLRWIAGDPTEVFGYANHKCLTDWPTDDCVIAVYKFPNNVNGKVFTSTGCCRDYTMRTVLYGTTGTIICDNTSTHLTLFQNGEKIEGHRRYSCPQLIPVHVNNHNINAEIDIFIDAILKGEPMPISSFEGAATIAVCTATVESTKTGRPVTIKYPSL